MKYLIIIAAVLAVCLLTASRCRRNPSSNETLPPDGVVEEVVPGVITEDDGASDNPFRAIAQTAAQKEVSARVLDFSLRFFSDMASRKEGDVMVSPFSLSMCLSMAGAGANGDTYTQIADALGFKGLDAGQVGEWYAYMAAALTDADRSSSIAIANAIWAREDLPLLPEYLRIATESYRSEASNLDFRQPEALRTVNGWISERTGGMIPEMLSVLNPATQLILANAVYFKGSWREGKFRSRKMDFTDYRGNKDKRDFFYGKREMRCFANNYVSLCAVPYGNGAYEMLVALPSQTLGLDGLLKELNAGAWADLRGEMEYREVEFAMPCFESRTTLESDELKAVLEGYGLTLPFSRFDADFSKMSSRPLYIDMILQKTAIDVNEKGTEAAAATVIGMLEATAIPDPEPPFRFIADHPFVYAILERSTGTILFAGVKRL